MAVALGDIKLYRGDDGEDHPCLIVGLNPSTSEAVCVVFYEQAGRIQWVKAHQDAYQDNYHDAPATVIPSPDEVG